MNLPPPARTRNVSPPEGAPGPQVITAGAGWPRCRQMAPTVDACNLGGLFCWRAQEWGSDALQLADDPEFIIDGAIEAQRKLLSGFGGDPRVPREQFIESLHPNQVAISLTGEPTLYLRLGETIAEYHARGMTRFLA